MGNRILKGYTISTLSISSHKHTPCYDLSAQQTGIDPTGIEAVLLPEFLLKLFYFFRYIMQLEHDIEQQPYSHQPIVMFGHELNIPPNLNP